MGAATSSAAHPPKQHLGVLSTPNPFSHGSLRASPKLFKGCPLLSTEHLLFPEGYFWAAPATLKTPFPLHLHNGTSTGKLPLQKQGYNTRPGTRAWPNACASPRL